jgi:predicted glycosyltransferase
LTPVPAPTRHGWVWVDFENTPHVLFLEPIIARLRANGCQVRITAKPQSQTLALAGARDMAVEPIGAGDLVGRPWKILGGLHRAVQLVRWVRRQGSPSLLVCSSRTAALAAYFLRIPVVGLLDYEHAEHRSLALASRTLWLPDVLQSIRLPRATRRVAQFYAGLKENLYLDAMALDRQAERAALGIRPTARLVVTRPPAATAHYASDRNYDIWLASIRGVAALPNVQVVVVPRNAEQTRQVTGDLDSITVARVLRDIVSGPTLIVAADLLIGGGGTMNREAAVLGVPVWSVFTGPTPAIDEQLAREGRLRWVRSMPELSAALRDGFPSRREGRGPFPAGLDAIVAEIERTVGSKQPVRV